jgi:gliotoxin biosynthesis cytochrome P450 monooxygenase
MQRLVTARKGLTLSPSVHLPKGTFVCFAHTQTQHTATLPQPPLDEFHPFRYAELRSITGEENKHQFVATALDSIYFGHGPNACAGRFFASNMIKVIVLELIKRYDIALGSKGEGVGGKIQRPATMTVGTNFIPNPQAEIFFRQR